jgi:hypothetical protein
MQQVQPAFRQAVRQSQHPWIMSQQALSPLVQVITHPSLVISHLHTPIIRLQVQTTIPFMTQHIEHIPPAIIEQRFCIIAQAVGSVHMQDTFIPPETFSTLKVHRGTIIMFGAMGVVPGIGAVPMPIPDIPFIVRSIIIDPVMFQPSSVGIKTGTIGTTRSTSRSDTYVQTWIPGPEKTVG